MWGRSSKDNNDTTCLLSLETKSKHVKSVHPCFIARYVHKMGKLGGVCQDIWLASSQIASSHRQPAARYQPRVWSKNQACSGQQPAPPMQHPQHSSVINAKQRLITNVIDFEILSSKHLAVKPKRPATSNPQPTASSQQAPGSNQPVSASSQQPVASM